MQEEKQHSPTLFLQVINSNELESGRAATCLFTTDGGNVGHAENCRWPVQDRRQTIREHACSLIWHDDAFCLKSQTPDMLINLAPVSPNSELVRLTQGDEIQLGLLRLKVFLHQGDVARFDEQMATPETIVMNRDTLTSTLLTTEGQPHYSGMPSRHDIAPTVAHGFSLDPLQVLQTETLTDGPASYSQATSYPPMSDLAESGGINSQFIDLPSVSRGAPTDVYDDPHSQEKMAHRHLALTPLMRGLNCSLAIRNTQEADDFLEETGRALQKAIKGLLSLQHQQNSLSDKHLRPL